MNKAADKNPPLIFLKSRLQMEIFYKIAQPSGFKKIIEISYFKHRFIKFFTQFSNKISSASSLKQFRHTGLNKKVPCRSGKGGYCENFRKNEDEMALDPAGSSSAGGMFYGISVL